MYEILHSDSLVFNFFKVRRGQFRDFMSNFREMAPQWLQNGCSKNLKLLKYEHIIYHFKARGLEISNT